MDLHPNSRTYQPSTSYFYVGSTMQTLIMREGNRIRKYRQVENEHPVHAEMALRYWSKHRNFFEYISIPLYWISAENKCELLAWEHLYISLWRPPLNHPDILKFFQCRPSGLLRTCHQPLTHGYRFIGTRLLRRQHIRHLRMYGTTINPTQLTSPQTGLLFRWRLLFDLSSFTQRSFVIGRLLHRSVITPDDLYVLYKLAKHLPEPWLSRARHKVAQILKNETSLALA